MSFIDVATRGAEDEPFQLAGRNPIRHVPGVQDEHDRLFEYSGGHLGFYGFLRVANHRISKRLMIGLMDLPDRLWRDAYEDGAHPSEAADEAISEIEEN
ncbi:hypothetical protein WDZ11_22785 (plasmid) [Roseomonas mucosa]|uniref:hypothetical protein n=1 Tax=Roseomonas mucosa TaxID=207340 RepID=UPI0030D1E106